VTFAQRPLIFGSSHVASLIQSEYAQPATIVRMIENRSSPRMLAIAFSRAISAGVQLPAWQDPICSAGFFPNHTASTVYRHCPLHQRRDSLCTMAAASNPIALPSSCATACSGA
jgi:hypothetical protein